MHRVPGAPLGSRDRERNQSEPLQESVLYQLLQAGLPDSLQLLPSTEQTLAFELRSCFSQGGPPPLAEPGHGPQGWSFLPNVGLPCSSPFTPSSCCAGCSSSDLRCHWNPPGLILLPTHHPGATGRLLFCIQCHQFFQGPT